MTGFLCPVCNSEIPPSSIPDAVLLSERGRRNGVKSKGLGYRGGRKKGATNLATRAKLAAKQAEAPAP